MGLGDVVKRKLLKVLQGSLTDDRHPRITKAYIILKFIYFSFVSGTETIILE